MTKRLPGVGQNDYDALVAKFAADVNVDQTTEVARMRQMLADKSPTIAPIDQDDWARNLNYREAPLAASLEQYSALRQANVRLLRQIEMQDLGKGAFHPERGRLITLAELFGMMVGHDPNHLRQIEALKEQARAAGAA